MASGRCYVGLGVAIIALISAAPEGVAWETTWDDAVAQSKRGDKPVLICFLGLDWSKHCQRLHEELLSTPEFAKSLSAEFILLRVSVPGFKERSVSKRLDPVGESLRTDLAVTGVPALVVVTPDRVPLARHEGYASRSREWWVTRMRRRTKAGLAVLEDLRELEDTPTPSSLEAKIAYGRRLASVVEREDKAMPLRGWRVQSLREFMELDPSGRHGLWVLALRALVKSGRASEEESRAAILADPRNERGAREWGVLRLYPEKKADFGTRKRKRAFIHQWESLLHYPIKDPAAQRQLLFCLASTLLDLGEKDRAVVYAKRLKTAMGDEPGFEGFFEQTLLPDFAPPVLDAKQRAAAKAVAGTYVQDRLRAWEEQKEKAHDAMDIWLEGRGFVRYLLNPDGTFLRTASITPSPAGSKGRRGTWIVRGDKIQLVDHRLIGESREPEPIVGTVEGDTLRLRPELSRSRDAMPFRRVTTAWKLATEPTDASQQQRLAFHVDRMDGRDPFALAESVEALLKMKVPAAVSAAIRVLREHSDPGLREYVARALRSQPTEAAVSALIDGLGDPAELVLIACLDTLLSYQGQEWGTRRARRRLRERELAPVQREFRAWFKKNGIRPPK